STPGDRIVAPGLRESLDYPPITVGRPSARRPSAPRPSLTLPLACCLTGGRHVRPHLAESSARSEGWTPWQGHAIQAVHPGGQARRGRELDSRARDPQACFSPIISWFRLTGTPTVAFVANDPKPGERSSHFCYFR